jgi:hypothetical protein
MILTGGNRNTWLKTCPSTTFFTTKLAGTYPGSNPGLRWEKPATNPLSHETDFPFFFLIKVLFYPVFLYFRKRIYIWEVTIKLNHCQGFSSYRAVNTLHLGYTNQSFSYCCSFLEPRKIHEYDVWAEGIVFER